MPLRSDRESFDQMRPSTIGAFVRHQTDAIEPSSDAYHRWIEARRISPVTRKLLSSSVDVGPMFSILMPTYKSDLGFLKKAIDSVRAQTYANWELCIVDDGSNDALLHEFVVRQASEEARILYQSLSGNVGIAAASNKALAMVKATL